MSGDTRCRNPPYDTDLQKLVKEKEVQTRKKAPLFGHTMIKDAQHIWASIGGKWGGGRSAHVAYYAYAEHHQLVDKRKCDGPLELAVQNGEHDDRLKRAVAYAYHLHTSDWSKFWYRYVNLDVRTKAIDQRLRTLDPKNQKRVWRDELLAELAATKEELVGEKLTYDEDGSEHVVDDVGFYGKHPVPVAFCVCVAVGNSDQFQVGYEWSAKFNDLETWFDGGVVEEAPPPPALPPVPAPLEPSPEPRTREGKKRAAGTKARRDGVKKTNGKRRKKAAADDAADEAEKKNDVVRTDASYRDFRPLINSVESDAAALAIDVDEALAELGVERREAREVARLLVGAVEGLRRDAAPEGVEPQQEEPLGR